MLRSDCWDDGPAGSASIGAASFSSSLRPWIDTHSHPWGIGTVCTSPSCVNACITAMDATGVKKAFFINPPEPAGSGNYADENTNAAAALYQPSRLFYGIGGSMLQSEIDKMPDSGVATEAQKLNFQTIFTTLISSTPAAVVIGETAALHLSYYPEHAFEENPVNSDLFYLLADLAATYDLAIDVHIDVVTQTMQTPSFYVAQSPNNPSTLQANIPDFEELLDHNPNTRIVLAHVGRDSTGAMTPGLIDGLLGSHGNLYAQIIPQENPPFTPNSFKDANDNITPGWLALVQKYPTRFVFGSDTFYDGSTSFRTLELAQKFLQQLSSDLAYQIGCTNPVAIYKLPSGC
ncbi:MAG: amidohydrolase family protein [Elusimicrobia bacterium]|nr:amidohydrolase family protein [Elusimicrobiota bacterium]